MSKSKNSFEDSMLALEKIVQELESGKTSLEESIKKYEEGVKVYKSCRSLLDKAEKKITILTDKLTEENFD
ncbi:MAG: exodeoxyribonuclease VII small subunit [Halobacteriovoraceae bacterium]|nr:exodeoxyribonuclease VII small subunit [Halobacteriovoraceae bacterium]|tara:strand:- start:834 stop:1046 length:213 start_codon:yes stop_codon:yes gene_type:complete